MNTADAARGKWRGILMALGVADTFLGKKHGPCPFCGGRDRFRFDDKEGKGSFFCSQCGAGDGFEFLKRLKGWDFKTAAVEIDRIVGNVAATAPKPGLSEKRRVEILNRLWLESAALKAGDPVCAYLEGRGVLPASPPAALRYSERCPVPYSDDKAPAMVALVRGPDGEAVNIHRTFLAAPGLGEKRVRAMMPGDLPEGSAVQIYPVRGARIGIAEGIETAIAAAKRFKVPTWAALNATMLAKWMPPAGVEEVVIFGDCDPSFGGQSAAYALAHRLAVRFHVRVEVQIPKQIGRDWADEDVA